MDSHNFFHVHTVTLLYLDNIAAANLLEEVQGNLKQRDRSETVHFLVSSNVLF